MDVMELRRGLMGMARSGSNIDVIGLIARTITSIDAPEITKVGKYGFGYCESLESVKLDNATEIGQYAFTYCSLLKRAYFPMCSRLYQYAFQYCGNLETAVFPLFDSGRTDSARLFSNCPKLKSADLNRVLINTNVFNGDTIFNQLILRNANAITELLNVNAFAGTPFANNGAGGTIYIPKALYDHLGDGTSLDYKAASNWSTLNGYGTITWAQIEGSYYETHYADDTPIQA